MVIFAFAANLSAQTVYQIVQQSADHTILETAIDAAELDDDLSGAGPFTLFAPTDAAFNALPAGTLDDLLMNPTGALANILLYHTVGANIASNTLATGVQATTVNGAKVLVVIDDGDVYINQAKVTMADLPADNGVVHVIDAVITPPTSAFDVINNSPIHSTLASLLESAELDDDVAGTGPFTIFAPVDEAFEDFDQDELNSITNVDGLLPRTLLTHVVSGVTLSTDLSNGLEINPLSGYEFTVEIDGSDVFLGLGQAEVIVANIEVPNGVIHIIDFPLFPFESSVAEVIENDDSLSTLNTALGAAGLVSALQDEDSEFTVFAPNNAAFAALDPDDLAALLADPMGDLSDILKYHVVPTALLSGNLKDGDVLETLQGQELSITIENDGPYVNGIKIIDIDYLGVNGAVHIIEGILLPADETTVVDIIVESPDHNTLETAVIAAGLVQTLSGDGPFTVFAPTDEAFAALGAELIDELLADPMGQLTTILTYHVTSGAVLSTDLTNGMVEMLSTESIDVNIDNGVVINGNAMVTTANLTAGNGVVHVIDAVLLPPTVSTENLLPIDFKFEISPNPTAEFININLGDLTNAGDTELILFDQLGRLVRAESNVAESSNWVVNDLAKGQYYLKLITAKGAAIRTLIVQ